MSRHEYVKMFKLMMRLLFHIAYQVEPDRGVYLQEIEKDYDNFLESLPYDGKQ